ncbi:MAG: ATP-binding cassette domain-containing protein [Oscillospiraceae bacterium]|jgi:ATP-binding cassette subfamily B protein|nr:ATP-binding cassette domain-containing protein [Oscillospiraceae bacterium]
MELKSVEFTNLNYSFVKKRITIKCDGSTKIISSASGTGKSTFVKSLVGIFPLDKENIFINGRAADDESLKLFLENIGYIGQQPKFFKGTIKENILLGVTETNLDKIFFFSCLDEEFAEGKLKLDSDVGFGGSAISGGQKKRLAIARALATAPKILFVDDFAEGLDVKTQGEMLKRFREDKSFSKVLVV